MGRKRAYLLRAVGGFGLLVLLVVAALALYQRRDFTSDFRDRKGPLVAVEETELDRGPASRTLAVTLRDDRGHRVNGMIQLPRSPARPTTALLLLGGLRTGRNTIEYIDDADDIVLMAIDYPYDGKKSGYSVIEFLVALPSIHEALMDTVPAGMLAVDYLLGRTEVDPSRIVVVGGSLGAILAPPLAATDERLAGLALIFGAGDIRALMAANLDMPAWVREPAAWMGAAITAPFEPLDYIGSISPRPVFMLSGLHDPRMPMRCSRKLHEAAREPKTVKIIEAGHVDIRATEFHDLVRRELEHWLHDTNLVPALAGAADSADAPTMQK